MAPHKPALALAIGPDLGKIGRDHTGYLGASLINETELTKLVLARVVAEGQAFAPGKVVVKLGDNQTVILRLFEIELPQLSPCALVRVAIFDWACRTAGFEPTAELFGAIFYVIVNSKTVVTLAGTWRTVFGSTNFNFRPELSDLWPVNASMPKWDRHWMPKRFYNSIPFEAASDAAKAMKWQRRAIILPLSWTWQVEVDKEEEADGLPRLVLPEGVNYDAEPSRKGKRARGKAAPRKHRPASFADSDADEEEAEGEEEGEEDAVDETGASASAEGVVEAAFVAFEPPLPGPRLSPLEPPWGKQAATETLGSDNSLSAPRFVSSNFETRAELVPFVKGVLHLISPVGGLVPFTELNEFDEGCTAAKACSFGSKDLGLSSRGKKRETQGLVDYYNDSESKMKAPRQELESERTATKDVTDEAKTACHTLRLALTDLGAKAEVKRFYDAGFIRPCRYAEWVFNIVPVIKKNSKVRVCIDFRDLNKATQKDEHPMPVANQLVDAASGHKILSFMDGNAGYNQIFMAEEDIHKIAFRCPGAIGLFEWVMMTFGLKSVGATYQRAMNYIYHDLIGWLVEVYIDDVVVKSKEIEDRIADLRKVFERTRKYSLKMKPTKCAFGVSAGQFLGFLVYERGIEITQRNVNAIKKIQPPEDKTELQEMIGKINFVRRLYLSAGEKSIGSVLIQELEGKEKVVFYLSRRLLDVETKYSPVEKLCLCLYFSCTKLRHYLLSNECTVICKADVVKYMLSALNLKGRVGKWIFALTKFDLRHESSKAIKGQAIADFIVDHRDDSIGSVEIVPWTLFFDGSVCTHGCGIGLVIISPRGASFEFAYTVKPYATNNQAEYEAVLKGLQLLKEVEADAVEIMGDSLLVISQLAGEYECKNDTLMVYNEKCRELMGEFLLVTLKHVSREQNVEANDLAQEAWGYRPMIKDVKVEVAAIRADNWRYEVHHYLQNPSQSASRKLRYEALKYTLLDDELYYRTIDWVLLKCLSADQAKVAIGEEFVQFADNMGIKLLNSSPYYAQANGQAEASNKNLIILIKRKISDYPWQWHTRLAEALWSYRMACHSSTQVPPYKLVYGHEAV
uniref:Retrotransposon protein, putative, unclassified n=1 Tax=Oryza sativa subsp. japonica TaxID=39947 RepID=Q53JW3_ORYSJ|nr:retrotransposon protein, putative, unclassified [Oryza sativa Japonica Group]